MERAKKKRRRYPAHRPAVAAGRVVGTLRKGVGVTGSYEGQVKLRMGNLQGWDKDHEFVMTSRQARDLGVRLVEQAAQSKVDRQRHVRQRRVSAVMARRRARQQATKSPST